MAKAESDKRRGLVRPVAILGPTASGKTAASVELAKRIGGEIISADSMAVYRGMNIGTAKPTLEEQQGVPFHMIDVVDPDEPFTVADFQEQGVRAIEEIAARGRVPLVVGGTGLYIRALIDGLNIPGPGPSREIRDRLVKLADEHGPEYLHEQLAKVDPAAAARLHPNDLKRVIRALEVYELTGAPMSEVIEETRLEGPRYPDAVQFGLTMDRAKLYRRIEDRVDEQTRMGLVDEVRGLLEKGYDVDLPSMQGLGYKEIAAYVKGLSDFEAAVELLKRNTRRFAKRQYTWFRADARIDWIDVDDLPSTEVADILEDKLRDRGILG